MGRLPAIVTLCCANAAYAAEHVVRIVGMNYQPATLSARVGDTIRFVNEDPADHNVFVPTRGFGIDLGVHKTGQGAVITLGRDGKFEVECVMHPHMKMTIQVSR